MTSDLCRAYNHPPICWRRCSKCGILKLDADFYARGDKPGLRSDCKACTRKRMGRYQEKLRAKAIRALAAIGKP